MCVIMHVTLLKMAGGEFKECEIEIPESNLTPDSDGYTWARVDSDGRGGFGRALWVEPAPPLPPYPATEAVKPG